MSDPILPFLPSSNNDAKVIDIKLTPEYQDLVRNVRAQAYSLENVWNGLIYLKNHFAIGTHFYASIRHYERRVGDIMNSLLDAIRTPQESTDIHKRFLDFAKFVLEESKVGNEEVVLRAINELQRMGVHVE